MNFLFYMILFENETFLENTVNLDYNEQLRTVQLFIGSLQLIRIDFCTKGLKNLYALTECHCSTKDSFFTYMSVHFGIQGVLDEDWNK